MDKHNKYELTEKIKLLETEIYNAKIDLKSLNRKLECCYEYEEDLVKRQQAAKQKNRRNAERVFSKIKRNIWDV